MKRTIEVSTPIRVTFTQARDVLLNDPGAVLSEPSTVGERDATRFRSELSVDVGAGASMHQEVIVELGVSHSTETRFVMPVAWHAGRRERLFPRFNGELELSESAGGVLLRLNGVYTVPLGAIGRVGDAVVGWRLAPRSLCELLERLAWRLESEVERRVDRARPSPPDLVAPTEWERSEIYIG